MSYEPEAIETFEDGDLVASIRYDTNPYDPRGDCKLGKMCLFANRYALPDEGPGGAEAAREAASKADVSLMVWGYIHSGITIKAGARTYPFNCPWDGGQLGVIYANLDDENVPDDWDTERLEEALRHEVEEYDQYLRGEVVGWTVENKRTGEHLDSCWGYYGIDYARNEAKSNLEYHAKKRTENLKHYIVKYHDKDGRVDMRVFWADDIGHAIELVEAQDDCDQVVTAYLV